MNSTSQTGVAWFTTKGQIVIPSAFRKEFAIEDGTKVIVSSTPEGILLRPVTAALIRRGRGLLKRPANAPSEQEERAGHKLREKALEDRHAR